jgi:hypothetical protein
VQAPQAVKDKAREIILAINEKKWKEEHVKEIEVQAEEHSHKKVFEKHATRDLKVRHACADKRCS